MTINMQKQDQQLGYDILGRLFSAAENYYLKCQGIQYLPQSANYYSYDIFSNANKKSREKVRMELINQINIFQTSNQYFISKYQYGLQPPNLKLAIDDVRKWKESMKDPKDKELYDAILKIINNGQVNTDNFSSQSKNQGHNKAGRQEFWANMGTYASSATQQRIHEINNNPNYQPTFNRGNASNPYSSSNPQEIEERVVQSEEANNILKILYVQIKNYCNDKKIIKEIKKSYNKLYKIKEGIDKKSKYMFPESIVPEEEFINFLDYIIGIERNPENKKIFSDIKELFVESLA